MSEFGGLPKHQGNPSCAACTKSVSLHNVEIGHYTEEDEEKQDPFAKQTAK